MEKSGVRFYGLPTGQGPCVANVRVAFQEVEKKIWEDNHFIRNLRPSATPNALPSFDSGPLLKDLSVHRSI